MPALLIRHRVADYAAWAPGFAGDGEARRAHGCQNARLFRDARDPSQVLVLLDWDDLERARLFAQSDELREALTRAEVADEPTLWLLEETDRPFD
jgi:heme-degrading monooxygenase HmoA